MRKKLSLKILSTDFLCIGGGAAGCYAALTFCGQSDGSVIVVEKANIRRSGCLAAGVNALNAYIVPGKTPEDYVAYARADAEGIAREDLLLTMAERLNKTVARVEKLGLTILKDEHGAYATRGNRNIKINGENIKLLLAAAVEREPRITVLNRVNAIDYIIQNGRAVGVFAASAEKEVLYAIYARAVLCATGGAAGLYKPNNPGFSRHKMWYPPFNTGAGYAMGIRAGAEMTTFEMRFVALRCKDTLAPTGTLAQGVGAKQVNALGEEYERRYGFTTALRVYGATRENLEGRGPCCLRTAGITPEQDEDLWRAYLNMAPIQTLKWIESDMPPSARNVEVVGSEPYIVGGHTASGYWVDASRETMIQGLFAAGDVAGGCPQKYVTGAFAEGEIAAESALKYMADEAPQPDLVKIEDFQSRLEKILNRPSADRADRAYKIDKADKINGSESFSPSADDLEAEMQDAMDRYAGGIGSGYAFSEASLRVAAQKINEIEAQTQSLLVPDMRSLLERFELTDRLTVCRSVLAHLAARKETRWRGFAENLDYPDKSDEGLKFVNSRLENGELKVFTREIGRGEKAGGVA
ncbi:MAG: adenylyl-sulfate reductase subunit alpha [Synergistaceae bacterium]|jgi:adenylylsulfate reductase subunit A|nr:adenylyl-sulfate reductase subunit alpha [Synergistaceae bacterium]